MVYTSLGAVIKFQLNFISDRLNGLDSTTGTDFYRAQPRWQPPCASGPHSPSANLIAYFEGNPGYDIWTGYQAADARGSNFILRIQHLRNRPKVMEPPVHPDPAKA